MKIEFLERLLSEKAWKNQPVSTNPGLVRQNLLVPRELRNGKFQNGQTARMIEKQGTFPPHDEDSYATGRNHIDFRATPFNHVDLCWEEGSGFQHPDLQTIPEKFQEILRQLDPNERCRYGVRYKKLFKSLQYPDALDLSDMSSQEETSEIDGGAPPSKVARKFKPRFHEFEQPRPQDFVLSDGESDNEDDVLQPPVSGNGDRNESDDLSSCYLTLRPGAPPGWKIPPRKNQEEEDEEDDDDEVDENGLGPGGFIMLPPKRKPETDGRTSPTKKNQDTSRSAGSSRSGPTKKNSSSSSSSGVTCPGWRAIPPKSPMVRRRKGSLHRRLALSSRISGVCREQVL
jgi:hypothetical protein